MPGAERRRVPRQKPTLLHLFMVFTITNYLFVFLFPRPSLTTAVEAPTWVFLIKDAVWAAFFGYALLRYRRLSDQLSSTYRTYLPAFIVVHLLLTSVSLLHVIQRTDPMINAREDLKNIVFYAAAVLILPYWIRNRKDITRYVRFLIWLGFAEGLFCFYNKFVLVDYQYEQRIFGSLDHYNHTAFFLSIVVFQALAQVAMVQKHSRWLYGVLVICVFGIAFTLSVAAMGMVLIYVLMLLWARKGLATLLRVITAVGVLFVFLLLTGLLDSAIERVNFAFSQDSSTISGRMNSLQEMGDYINNATLAEILVGDFRSQEYVMYDSMWLILIRNNGILPVFAMGLFFVLVARVAFRKYKMCRRIGDSEMAAILFASGSFVLVAVLFSFNITAYLSKFPLHFYFYMLCALILLAKPAQASNRTASDLARGLRPVNR